MTTPDEQDDLWTLSALGVLSYAVGDAVHEALGHGGACLLQGGRIHLLSSAFFRSAPGSAWTDLGGPFANFAAALAFDLLAKRARLAPTAKLFLRLGCVFNLFWASGQMPFSAVSMKDDWAYPISQLAPRLLWRILLGAAGIALYTWTVRWFRRADGSPSTRLRKVYFAAGMAACAAALFYAPDRLEAVHQAALETFGANLGLFFAGLKPSPPGPAPIARNVGWIMAAGLAFLLFAATLGRGITA